MGINSQLAEIIKKIGIKQIAICKATGITPDAMSGILSGKRKIMADEFLSICSFLHIDPAVFSRP